MSVHMAAFLLRNSPLPPAPAGSAHMFAGFGSTRKRAWRLCYRRPSPPCCGMHTPMQTSMGESRQPAKQGHSQGVNAGMHVGTGMNLAGRHRSVDVAHCSTVRSLILRPATAPPMCSAQDVVPQWRVPRAGAQRTTWGSRRVPSSWFCTSHAAAQACGSRAICSSGRRHQVMHATDKTTSCHLCRFYAPERDMQLVRKINPHPMTWADFLRTTGYDGTQSEEEIRAKFIR